MRTAERDNLSAVLLCAVRGGWVVVILVWFRRFARLVDEVRMHNHRAMEQDMALLPPNAFYTVIKAKQSLEAQAMIGARQPQPCQPDCSVQQLKAAPSAELIHHRRGELTGACAIQPERGKHDQEE